MVKHNSVNVMFDIGFLKQYHTYIDNNLGNKIGFIDNLYGIEADCEITDW